MQVDESTDVGLELFDGGVNTSLDLLSDEFREPALDLIDPGRRSRREVDMIVRPASELRFDLGRLVGGIVVYDNMDSEPLGDLSVDLFEELQKLDCPMALVALPMTNPEATLSAAKSVVVPCRT